MVFSTLNILRSCVCVCVYGWGGIVGVLFSLCFCNALIDVLSSRLGFENNGILIIIQMLLFKLCFSVGLILGVFVDAQCFNRCCLCMITFFLNTCILIYMHKCYCENILII